MEPAGLLRFLRKLKEVFDVCDEDADGFIRVEHFVALGLQFGQGDEVSGTPLDAARSSPTPAERSAGPGAASPRCSVGRSPSRGSRSPSEPPSPRRIPVAARAFPPGSGTAAPSVAPL